MFHAKRSTAWQCLPSSVYTERRYKLFAYREADAQGSAAAQRRLRTGQSAVVRSRCFRLASQSGHGSWAAGIKNERCPEHPARAAEVHPAGQEAEWSTPAVNAQGGCCIHDSQWLSSSSIPSKGLPAPSRTAASKVAFTKGSSWITVAAAATSSDGVVSVVPSAACTCEG